MRSIYGDALYSSLPPTTPNCIFVDNEMTSPSKEPNYTKDEDNMKILLWVLHVIFSKACFLKAFAVFYRTAEALGAIRKSVKNNRHIEYPLLLREHFKLVEHF